jgi:signal transduction histidine kinase
VTTLLALARADTGHLTPDRAQFDLNEAVGLVVEQYAPRAEAAGVTLRNKGTPAPLVADEDLLMQVLVNLIDNALTHTPAGGTVTVGCRTERERVRLWVTDTGAGIPPEHQPRIFDRFYRVDTGRARQPPHGGAGLGLAISKAIAEAHGGTIDLTSRVSEGTRVDVLLPTAR